MKINTKSLFNISQKKLNKNLVTKDLIHVTEKFLIDF